MRRLLDRLFPSRVVERDRREFFARFARDTTCMTCGHARCGHSVVQAGGPCLLSTCHCPSFEWPTSARIAT